MTITPWRDAGEDKDEGDAEATTYTVALPSPGSELFWEAGNLIGPGIAVAPRCYVRRRDPGGAWGGDDYLQDTVVLCGATPSGFGDPYPLRFRAWISDGTDSPSNRFDHSPGRYVLPTGHRRRRGDLRRQYLRRRGRVR